MAHLGDWENDLVTGKAIWSDEQYHIFGLSPQSVEPSLQLMLKYVHPGDLERVNEEINLLDTKVP